MFSEINKNRPCSWDVNQDDYMLSLSTFLDAAPLIRGASSLAGIFYASLGAVAAFAHRDIWMFILLFQGAWLWVFATSITIKDMQETVLKKNGIL